MNHQFVTLLCCVGTNGDVPELETYLLPLLEKYKVHAYICGHDHTAEHLRRAGYNTEFFVVGAGTMTDTVTEGSSAADVVWAGPSYASFGAVDATESKLNVSYYDTDTTLRYSYTFDNPLRPASDPGTAPPPADVDGGGGRGGGRVSLLTWPYWQQATSSSDFAMASGGIAALGLVLILCHAVYWRSKKTHEKLTKESFLAKARAAKMVTTPTGGGRTRSHQRSHSGSSGSSRGRNYVELMEEGEADSRHSARSLSLGDTDSEEELAALKSSSPNKFEAAPIATVTTAESVLFSNLLELEPAVIVQSRSAASLLQQQCTPPTPPSPKSTMRHNSPTHSVRPSDVPGQLARSRASSHLPDEESLQQASSLVASPRTVAQTSSPPEGHRSRALSHDSAGSVLSPEQAVIATNWLSRTTSRPLSPGPVVAVPPPTSPHSRRPSNASHTSARTSLSPDLPPQSRVMSPLGIAEANQIGHARTSSAGSAMHFLHPSHGAESSPGLSELTSGSPPLQRPPAYTHRRTGTAPM
jgi:hypothetical protein